MKKKTKETLINIGSGKDYKIKEYAKIFSKVITPNLSFKIKYDLSKPNGTPRKVLDVSLAKKYGWTKKTELTKAIKYTYEDFVKKIKNGKGRPVCDSYCFSVDF